MECLLCDYISNSVDDIKKHYINLHKINKDNFFFKELFSRDNFFINYECIRCGCFLTTIKKKARHNFLKHYSDGEKKTDRT